MDSEMTVKHSVVFPTVYSTGSTVDVNSASGQPLLSVAATTNFNATDFAKGWRVIINRGGEREEERTVLSINAGVSISFDVNLTYTHTAAQADVVEVCWAALSEVINKKHYKKIVLFVPADWTTAALSYLGCPEPDGTFLQVMGATAVTELTSAAVVASRCIVMDGIHMEGLGVIPYLKIRSGVAGTEVDQYTKGVKIRYVLMR